MTFSKSFTTGIVVGVTNFSGVDQATPLDLAAKQKATTGNTVSSISVNVTTAGGDELVFDTVFVGGATAPTLTPNVARLPVGIWVRPTHGWCRGRRGQHQSSRHGWRPVTDELDTQPNGYLAMAAVAINPAPAGPTVTINQAVGQADPTNASPVNFTAVFSEAVTGFETGDVTLSGTADATTGTVTEIAPNDGTTYNVAVSGMTGSGSVIASIAAGVAQNGSAQTNAASTSTDNSVTWDVTAPTVTINQKTTEPAQADPTTASPINFTVVFNEPVTDFVTGDVNLSSSTALGTLTGTVTGGGTTYNVAVSGMTGSGDVTATVDAGVAHDAAGNPSTASTSTDNTVAFDYDTASPTVAIDKAAEQADPTTASPINFTVVFNEPVTDFVTGDVNLSSSTALGTLTGTVTGGGTTYNVAVSGMTGSGDVTATVDAGVAHDAAGNPSAASTSNDNTVAYRYFGLDGAVSSNTADDVNSITVDHTTGTRENRLLLVGVSWNCGSTSGANQTISAITFTPDGGTPVDLSTGLVWTERGGATTGTIQYRYSAIYSLVNPPSGLGRLEITFSDIVPSGIVAGVATFSGVDQTDPLGTADGANLTGDRYPTVTLDELAGGELVFDNVFQGGTDSNQTLTVGSGQSEKWNAFAGNTRAAASTKWAPVTSRGATMNWTAASTAYGQSPRCPSTQHLSTPPPRRAR